MLCSAGSGIGPPKSMSGGENARIGAKTSSAFAVARVAPEITHIFFRWCSAGNGGTGRHGEEAEEAVEVLGRVRG